MNISNILDSNGTPPNNDVATTSSDLYMINQITRPEGVVTGESNLLEHFNLLNILNDFKSKHLSSTYKSYVKNLPGDTYIRREKHHHHHSDRQSTSTPIGHQNVGTPTSVATPTGPILSPQQQLQQQQQQQQQEAQQRKDNEKRQQQNVVNGLAKLVEGITNTGIAYEDDQQELILLSLSEPQMMAAFTLMDGGYVRPEKEKRKHRDKNRGDKKKRKNREGGDIADGVGGDSDRHKRKKKSKRDGSGEMDMQHVVLEH
ncbi:hypothetical protein SAMD00019534_033090 [Acytostelium subglobosum LB1]|uniref:hypothetical protein n=1 Tax=Acytostelium subglobosum LB1 TaxID=1410327 RepID=UPI000644C110|nr:hypothetical protein SAMD00019534_033090 [Acytostelium subglobosum LB1]GAM20134.1 hypothetical protein SAMD00019534_033090 [Acytostelium subglobosum LB1]|eukprot:XP_012756896.1 hypothetical protein SAMD00019534_033090 [Acytostelium subglobosum LB1]